MEEILFRAKAINRNPNREYRSNYKNGDWVFGLLTRKKETFADDYVLCAEMTDLQGISGIDVEMDTLGQFTGKCDKNGKKIFECDIVRCDTALYKNVEGIIKYSENACCFYINAFGSSDDYLFNCENIVVVANIHDNPELLEGV